MGDGEKEKEPMRNCFCVYLARTTQGKSVGLSSFPKVSHVYFFHGFSVYLVLWALGKFAIPCSVRLLVNFIHNPPFGLLDKNAIYKHHNKLYMT